MKSLNQHKLDGTYRPDRHGAQDSQGVQSKVGGCGPAPEWLVPDAREEWDRLHADEDFLRICGPLHRSGLIQFCTLHAEIIQAGKDRIQLTASTHSALANIRAQMGLTPVHQHKVAARSKAEKPRNKWADLDRTTEGEIQ